MTPELENRAKQIFEEKYIDSLGGIEKCLDAKFQCNSWKRNNISVYTNVILPSIVQALSESTSAEIAQVQFEEINDGKMVIGCGTESKIQPGQKLKDGDCFVGGTVDQYHEIYNIEKPGHPEINFADAQTVMNDHTGVYYSAEQEYLIFAGKCDGKTKYSFQDYVELCKNTFQG